MNKTIICLIAFIVLVSFVRRDRMIGKKMPGITGQTINGKIIDTTYFKNKVTLVTFMYIGCTGCMLEISVLNKINKIYSGKDFQILCIAPHTEQQVKAFNSDDTTGYSSIRRYFKADKVEYDILPECEKEKPRTKKEIEQDVVMPECERISKLFRVNSFPQSFLVDKKGIIRNHYEGYAVQEDSVTIKDLCIDIDKLLN